MEKYATSTSRQDKSDILSTIVNTVRGNSPNGGFVKEDNATGHWFEVGDFLAREKVSQAFRDALSHSYRSSKKYKHEKRRIRDKAAKVAKQMTEGGKPAASSKASKRKSLPNRPSSPLQRRGKLSVLREEKMPSSMSLQGNAEPNRPSAAMTAVDAPAIFQGSQSQFLGDPPGAQFGQFPGQLGMPSQDMMGAGGQHTSWSRLFPPSNSIFNPAQSAMNAQAAAMAQQRRFSEAMMTGGSSHPMGPHAFHHSDPNLNWSSHLEYPGAAASLHASFPTGMSLHAQQHGGVFDMSGMAGATGMAAGMATGMPQEHMPRVPQHQHTRSRSLPLDRSGSNVSANAIVARLESALPEISHHQDENPFEPVPLPGGTDPPDDDSILHDW